MVGEREREGRARMGKGRGGCTSLRLEFNFFVTKESRKRAKRGCTLRKEGRKEGWGGSGGSKRGETGEDRRVQEKSHSCKLDGLASTKLRLAIKNFPNSRRASLFSFRFHFFIDTFFLR